MYLELWSGTNATTVVFARITGERCWRIEEKCLCIVSWLKRSWVHGSMEKREHFLVVYSTSNKFLVVARHALITGLRICLWSWHCKLHEFIVTPFHCEVRTRSKNKGLKQCWVKVKGVNNPTWTTQQSKTGTSENWHISCSRGRNTSADRMSDGEARLNTVTGSSPQRSKEFFSQSQLPVQTVLQCS